MSEPQYGEPWRNCPDFRRLGPFDDHEGRAVRCVNLLARVPDAAPCFSPGPKSDEVQLALAVLAGETGAAGALADEVTERYGREHRVFHEGEDILAYYEDKINALAEECVERIKTLRGEGVSLSVQRNAIMNAIRTRVLGPCGRGVTTTPPLDFDLPADPNGGE